MNRGTRCQTFRGRGRQKGKVLTGDAKSRNVTALIDSDQGNLVVDVTVVEADLNFAGVADQVIGC
jgi:hypothetical protein